MDREEAERRFEHYCFLRYCWRDFAVARETLALLSGLNDASLRLVVLEKIVVSYYRPFSGNRGSLLPPDEEGNRKNRQYRFSTAHVPEELKDLHSLLRELRNQLFAHTDVLAQEPSVACMLGTRERPCYPITYKGPDYRDLEVRLPDVDTLAEMGQLAAADAIFASQREPWFPSMLSDRLDFGTITIRPELGPIQESTIIICLPPIAPAPPLLRGGTF